MGYLWLTPCGGGAGGFGMLKVECCNVGFVGRRKVGERGKTVRSAREIGGSVERWAVLLVFR